MAGGAGLRARARRWPANQQAGTEARLTESSENLRCGQGSTPLAAGGR